MKKQLFSLLAIGAMTFGLASCSNDEPAPNGNDLVGQGEGIGYMSFAITNSNDSRSRADNEIVGDGTAGTDVPIDDEVFNNGDTYEYAIAPNTKANVALFFDANGVFYGSSYLNPYSPTDQANHGATHTDGYPEKFYTFITRWRNQTADNSFQSADKPSQVLVLLNVNPDCINQVILDAQNAGANALETVTKEIGANADAHSPYGVYDLGGKRYFSMSNSVYVDSSNKVVTATPINAADICETPEKALEHPVTIFVERMLAKFEITFKSTTAPQYLAANNDIWLEPFAAESTPAQVGYVANYTGEDEITLDFPAFKSINWDVYVVNWGVNGVEPKSYVYKQINTTNPFPAGKNDGWNSEALHRSYWAISPQYNATGEDLFPTQYRNASYDTDYASLGQYFWGTGAVTGTGEQTTASETALTYYSFNHFATRAMFRYAPERTYTKEAATMEKGYSGYTPYRFASHILLTTQLVFKGQTDKAGNELDTDVTTKDGNVLSNVADKYMAYNFFWGNKESYIRYAYRRMMTDLVDGREHTTVFNGTTYKFQGDNVATLYTDTQGTELEVKDAHTAFELVPAQLVHGDGKLVLNPTKTLYYKDGDEYKELPAATLVAFIYNKTDAVKHFAKGMMYYAIPVQHMFGTSAGLSKNYKVDVKRDNSVYETGQFGVVRNHWYKFHVTTVGSIGIPVDEPDQPIIPDPEDNFNIALEIVVLPWHVIDNGVVDL